MLIQKESLVKLRDFGLNTYESKLWFALLSRGISTAGELSDIANVPRSRSYDVLESLEKKGFIVMKLGKPIKYLAVAPIEVLERVKKKIQSEATENISMLEKLESSSILSELEALHIQGIDTLDPTDISGYLKNRTSIYTHLDSVFKNAKKSIVILTSEEGFLRKSDALYGSLQRAKTRGVSIRIAAPIQKKYSKTLLHISQIADLRHTATRGRFSIIDDKDVIFMLASDDQVHPNYDVGVWVDSPFFAQTLSTLFEKEWKTMVPVSKLLKK